MTFKHIATREHVLCLVVFSGDLPEVDSDRAACELEQAGYKVTRLPDKLGALLLGPFNHPLDDFLEAAIEVNVNGPADDAADAVHRHVNSIVEPLGGTVDQWGPLDQDHVPFADVFSGNKKGRAAMAEVARSAFYVVK